MYYVHLPPAIARAASSAGRTSFPNCSWTLKPSNGPTSEKKKKSKIKTNKENHCMPV